MPRHKKHRDNLGDSSSSGSVMDDTDHEVSCLTDRAFRSLCVAEEEPLNGIHHIHSPGKTKQLSKFHQVTLNHATSRSNFLNRLSLQANEHAKWASTFQDLPKFLHEEQKGPKKTLNKPSVVEFSVPDLRKHSQRSKVSSLIKTFDNIENECPGIPSFGTQQSHPKSSQKYKGCPVGESEASAVLSTRNEVSEFSDACQENYWLNEKYGAHKRRIGKNLAHPAYDRLNPTARSTSQVPGSSPCSSPKKTLKHQTDEGKEQANKSIFLHSEHSAFKSWSDHSQRRVEKHDWVAWTPEKVIIQACDMIQPLKATHASVHEELRSKRITDRSLEHRLETDPASLLSSNRQRTTVTLQEKEVCMEAASPSSSSSSSSSSLISSHNTMAKKQVEMLPIEVLSSLPSSTSNHRTMARSQEKELLVDVPPSLPLSSTLSKRAITNNQAKEHLQKAPPSLPISPTSSHMTMTKTWEKELLVDVPPSLPLLSISSHRNMAKKKQFPTEVPPSIPVSPTPSHRPRAKSQEKDPITGVPSSLPVTSASCHRSMAKSQERGPQMGTAPLSQLLSTTNIINQDDMLHMETATLAHDKRDNVKSYDKWVCMEAEPSSSNVLSPSSSTTKMNNRETEHASPLLAPNRHSALVSGQEKVLMEATSSLSSQSRRSLIQKQGKDHRTETGALSYTPETNKRLMATHEMGAAMDVCPSPIPNSKRTTVASHREDVPMDTSSPLLTSHISNTMDPNQTEDAVRKVASASSLTSKSNKMKNVFQQEADIPMEAVPSPPVRNMTMVKKQDHVVPMDSNPSPSVSQAAISEVNTSSADLNHELRSGCAPWRRGKAKKRMQQEIPNENAKTQQNVCVSHRPATATAPYAEATQVTKQECPIRSTSPSFNITKLLTPIIIRKHIMDALEDDPELITPPPGDISAMKDHETRTAADSISRENYRSKASSLLFNIKDVRKRVKSTYSPSPLLKNLDEQSNYRENGKMEKVDSGKTEKGKLEKRKAEKENVPNKMEREKLEKEKLEKEKIEREKIEREMLEKVEKEKIERDKIEKDRIEKFETEKMEKLHKREREKIERENMEQLEEQAREKVERENIGEEEIKKEKLEKQEREKITREKIEREKLDKQKWKNIKREKTEREKMEQLEKQASEKREKSEREMIEREKLENIEKDKMSKHLKIKREDIERENMENLEKWKKIERENMEQLEKQKKIERENMEQLEKQKKIERENMEQLEKQEREKIEKEKLQMIEREKIEREKWEKVEKEKLERERTERERTEKERTEKEQMQKKLEEQEREKIKRENTEREKLQKEKLEKAKMALEKENRQFEKEKMENEKPISDKTGLLEESIKVPRRKKKATNLVAEQNLRTFEKENKVEFSGHLADNYLTLSSPQTIQDNVSFQNGEQLKTDVRRTDTELSKETINRDNWATQDNNQKGEMSDPFLHLYLKENVGIQGEQEVPSAGESLIASNKLQDYKYQEGVEKPESALSRHLSSSPLLHKADSAYSEEQVPSVQSNGKKDHGRAIPSKSQFSSFDEHPSEEQTPCFMEGQDASQNKAEARPGSTVMARDVAKEERQYYALSHCHPKERERSEAPPLQRENRWEVKDGLLGKLEKEHGENSITGFSSEKPKNNAPSLVEPQRPSSTSFKPNLFTIKDNRCKSSSVTRAVKLPLLRSMSEECLFSCQWDGGWRSAEAMGKERLGFKELRDTQKAIEKRIERTMKQTSAKPIDTKTNTHGLDPGLSITQQLSLSETEARRSLRLGNRSYSMPKLPDGNDDMAHVFSKTGKSKETEGRPISRDTTAFIHARSISFESCTSLEDGLFFSAPNSDSEDRMQAFEDESMPDRRGASAMKAAISDEIMASPVVSPDFVDCLYSPGSAASEDLPHFVDSAEYPEDFTCSTITSPMSESITCSFVTSPVSENTTSSGFATAMSTSEGLPSPSVTEGRLKGESKPAIVREPLEDVTDLDQRILILENQEATKEGKERAHPLSSTDKMTAKPPTVPPKTEKALRRAKRLASKRRKTEAQQQKKMPVDGAEPVLSVPSPMTASPAPVAMASCPPSPVHHKLEFPPTDPSVLRHTGAKSVAPASQLPMTQRKLLQDPNSGQYFVVDVPVQVQVKTFYDPETGKYIQVSVPSSDGNLTRASSTEVLNSPYVLYPGYLPMPITSLPPTRSSSQLSSPAALMQEQLKVDKSEAWNRDPASRDFVEKHPYIEPVCDSYSSSPYSMDTDSYDSRRRDIISMGDLEDFAVEGIS